MVFQNMRPWIIRHLWLVEIVFLLLGLVIVLGGAAVEISDELRLATLTIGTAIIASSMLALFHSMLGADPRTVLAEYVDERLGAKQRVYDMGLDAVHPTMGDQSVYERFNQAQSIDMYYNTGMNTIQANGHRIAEAITNRGCNVRVIVSSPGHPLWQHPPTVNALCPGRDVVSDVGDVINRLQAIASDLQSRTPPVQGGSIEIKTYPGVPTCSIVLVDRHVVRVTPYLPFTHSAEVPTYDIVRNRGGRIFDQYHRAFERAWNHPECETQFKIVFAPARRNRQGRRQRQALAPNAN